MEIYLYNQISIYIGIDGISEEESDKEIYLSVYFYDKASTLINKLKILDIDDNVTDSIMILVMKL